MSATPVKDGSTSSSDHEVALEVRAARKSFGHVTALQGASLTLRRGEVTALVGDNGAGKSTLVKVISGVIQPDSGSIHVAGEQITMRDPQAGRAKGIHTVFQDLALVDPLSTTENMFLGDEIRTKVGPFTLPWLNRQAMRRETRRALSDLRVTTLKDVEMPIEMLSGGQRQSVAIARAVRERAAVVLLDEPTAALGVSQAEQVLELIGRLREQDTAVMVISHNLREVFAVADRIVVMRLGTIAATFTVKNTNEEEVVSAIVGTRREPDADADEQRRDQ
jgi:ABC-type sugar transport system ATPase subunit